MSKRVAIKGDEYEMDDEDWKETYKTAPENPPPPSPKDPEDPKKYASPPELGPFNSIKERPLPNSGKEYVFCEGKPVLTIGDKFSKITKNLYVRTWILDEEGHIKKGAGDKDPKTGKKKDYKDINTGNSSMDISVLDGVDYVFIDGIPISCVNGGVTGAGVKIIYVDGKPVAAGSDSAHGVFTDCYGHVYSDV